MLPALREYVAPVSIVHLKVDQLTAIRGSVASQRPQSRLGKNIFYPGGLVMQDYCVLQQEGQGPVLAVEIKPKKGFVSSSNSLCEFCLKQREKVRAGQAKTESKYCPLDLFSGSRDRMTAAIRNLLENPQNNLRIFKDGNLLHDEISANTPACAVLLAEMFGSKSCLAEILVHLLSQEKGKEIVLKNTVNACDNPKSKGSLPAKTLLNDILKLQKINSLSEAEAEGVVDDLVEGGLDMSDILLVVTGGQSERKITEVQAENLEKLGKYLVSRTARDLSIIVTIQEDRPGLESSDTNDRRTIFNNRLYRYNLSVIDLDPKKLRRISSSISKDTPGGAARARGEAGLNIGNR